MAESNKETAYQATIRALSVAQKLTTKAIEAENVDNLIFIILNDTYHVLPYDRAILFTREENRIRELGVSGQSTYKADNELVTRMKTLVKNLKDPATSRVLSAEDVEGSQEDWNYLQTIRATTVFWIPFQLKDGSHMGLWLEKWGDPNATQYFEQNAKLLTELVIPGYVAAWNRIGWGFSWHKLLGKVTLPRVSVVLGVLLLLTLMIRLPLRVVAPCEVVALDPYVIAAPLEGIIEKVVVEPGEQVSKDQILYEYDKRIPEQEYKVAQKEVEVIQSELNRIFASGLKDESQLYNLATLNVKLKKSELDLAFAKSRLELLMGKAEEAGVVSLDNPDDWSGKPVQVGEKIMILSNPEKTKLRIWIPEKDNLAFDKELPIKIFLNPTPEESFTATLLFISQEIRISTNQIPSFIAEAEWTEQSPDIKLGLKGSAILYGERVSLLYYFLRKPIIAFRAFVGI